MNRGRRSGPTKAAGRRNDNNRIYAHPLPLIFSSREPNSTSTFSSLLGSLGLGGSRVEILNPHCEGVFDPATRSVWVTNAKDSRILWTRGFFGKGNLSRSEPSWLARQVNSRKDKASGKCMFVPCSIFISSIHLAILVHVFSRQLFLQLSFALFSIHPPHLRVSVLLRLRLVFCLFGCDRCLMHCPQCSSRALLSSILLSPHPGSVNLNEITHASFLSLPFLSPGFRLLTFHTQTFSLQNNY